MKKLLLLLVVISALSSCAIEKRHYRSGFYVFKNSSVESREIPDKIPEGSEPFAVLPDNVTIFSDTAFVGSPESMPAPEPSAVRARQNTGKKVVAPAADPIKEPQRPAPDKRGMQRTVGWVCLSLAVVSLFFLWPLIFFIVPGIIFLVLGYSKGSGDKGGDLEDVVYLKNGSIIRGVIIEQVPGVSLKIKTKDGSVFFYKMEEIDKITKE